MRLASLYEVVRSIPKGKVATYGDVGKALPNPATGRMVGRWMAQCDGDVPWWRVVAQTGELPVHKRDPKLASDQMRILRKEGVKITDNRIEMSTYRCSLDELVRK